MPVFELFGREHPAFVHLPIAASLLLPLALALSLTQPGWIKGARLLAWAAFAGGLAAIVSGLIWARAMELIAPGSFLPSRSGLLGTHEALAFSGLILGGATLFLLERKQVRAALVASLLWAGAWGLTGHWGGRMVFPEPEATALLFPFLEAPWATLV